MKKATPKDRLCWNEQIINAEPAVNVAYQTVPSGVSLL